MKLTPPLPLSRIGQGFGQNKDPAYAAQGLLGHPGIDFGGDIDWGKPIPSPIQGAIVSALLSKDNPNLEGYRATNMLYDDMDGSSYEIQFGHCSKMTSVVGKPYADGQAYIGNTGDVYTGQPPHLVTDAEKKAGSHAGAHVHFQVRKVIKQPVNAPDITGVTYLNDGSGRLTLNGFKYYWIQNGYNGCIDPAPFFDGGQKASDQLYALADSMQATNAYQAGIVRAVANIVKAWGN